MNDGFARSAYQVLTESIEEKDPTNPLNKHIDTEDISLHIVFISDHTLTLHWKQA